MEKNTQQTDTIDYDHGHDSAGANRKDGELFPQRCLSDERPGDIRDAKIVVMYPVLEAKMSLIHDVKDLGYP